MGNHHDMQDSYSFVQVLVPETSCEIVPEVLKSMRIQQHMLCGYSKGEGLMQETVY
jgi:hypothetical protein